MARSHYHIHVDLSSEWLCGIPLREIWQEVFSASIRKMHFENDIEYTIEFSMGIKLNKAQFGSIAISHDPELVCLVPTPTLAYNQRDYVSFTWQQFHRLKLKPSHPLPVS